MQDQSIKNILLVFLFVLIFTLLYILGGILIPLFMALLFSMMFQPVIAFLKKNKTPNWLILPILSLISLLAIFGVYQVIYGIINSIMGNQEFYIERLNLRIGEFDAWLWDFTGIKFIEEGEINYLGAIFDKLQLNAIGARVGEALGSFTGSFVIFALYYVILLSGMTNYKKYLQYVSGKEGEEDNAFVRNFEKIQKSVVSYMIIKFVVSFATGLLIFLICLAFGLNFPFFFGFMAFILHFIPNVGSIAGAVLPFIMAVIQFDSVEAMILLLVACGAVEAIMGNAVEPLVMGDKLKLNTLTVIFGLVFWGYIWGIPGMVMSVPLMVLFKLILEEIPSTKLFARVLG